MCQRITCKVCGKPSYSGCGRHIEAVLGDVPPSLRCRCKEEGGARASGGGSFLDAFLGRKRERS
jgi:hypothetical protein